MTAAILGTGTRESPVSIAATRSGSAVCQSPSLLPVWGTQEPGHYAITDNNDPVKARTTDYPDRHQVAMAGAESLCTGRRVAMAGAKSLCTGLSAMHGKPASQSNGPETPCQGFSASARCPPYTSRFSPCPPGRQRYTRCSRLSRQPASSQKRYPQPLSHFRERVCPTGRKRSHSRRVLPWPRVSNAGSRPASR